MFKAALFDMDGTMVDTEIVQSRAFEKILQEHGVQPVMNEQGIVHTPGVPSDVIWDMLRDTHQLATDTRTLTIQKRQAVLDILSEGIEPMPGLIQFLMNLERHRVGIAVATSAQRERVDMMIEKLGTVQYISASVTANDVERVKPAPDAYLAAAQALGVVIDECVVFEDTDVGVQAGKAAGMKVVAIPNIYTSHMDFSQADLVVPSMEQLSYQAVSRLFTD